MNTYSKKTILVVDDEDALRTMVCEFLETQGYDTVEASNGEAALYCVTQEHFDAIISDVRMPSMSGFDLMYALDKLCEDTLLILLTAVPDPDLKLTRLAKAAGVYAYLNKPCKLDELLKTLEQGFAHQEASRQMILSVDDFSEEAVVTLGNIISEATQNAISGIAGMVGRDVNISYAAPKQVSASNVADLLKNPEGKLVGVNLDIQGDTSGHMLLIYPPQVAYGLADLITGEPLGTTQNLEEMGESALKEMGNVAGGFFLNSLADATNMRLMPSPPTLIMGAAGRILDNAFRPMANKDAKVFVVQMTFETNSQQVSGYFLILSAPQFLNKIVERNSNVQAVTA